MIERLIDASVRNRGLVVALLLVLLAAGSWTVKTIAIDAIPDLSDVQVVIRTEYTGQAPQIVEDQVTYPLTTAMLAVPLAKVVRGYSMFGTSFVYIIFEDGTDMYWARSRVLEQLSVVSGKLPEGVSPQLGPDATGVGWIYEYVLTTEPGTTDVDLSDLRGLQDWFLRYELTGVQGVSEVASLGGFVKQYQVVVDPVRLRAYNIPLSRVKAAIAGSNRDVGGRLIEMSETEYMVRSIGYLGSLTDTEIAAIRAAKGSVEEARTRRVLDGLRHAALAATADGTPIYLRDVAEVRIGPEIRRGIAEWNGEGEVVGGVVVMRHGENARATIDRVKAKLADLEKSLPEGVKIEVGYDRSDLIDRAAATLTSTLLEEMLVVTLICILFLLHARSALVAAFVLPSGVLLSLMLMKLLGINANIMSLGGLAIAIGVMVDSSVIMVENAHKHLEHDRERRARGEPGRPRADVIAEAAREVGPSLFFSLLIITVSFVPVFALGEQSGRLFKPLAYTKTFAMGASALLAVTVIPVLMVFFISERTVPASWPRRRRLAVYAVTLLVPALALALVPLDTLGAWRWWLVAGWLVLAGLVLLPQRLLTEEANPISRLLQRVYEPAFQLVMKHRVATLVAACAAILVTIYPLSQLGSEFMPPLEEGDLLYMPTTDPGVSMTKARELLQQTDRLIKSFPEVDRVFGKAGRAETATDPAPPSMLETTITLHRDKDRWRSVPIERFYDWLPDVAQTPFRWILPDERKITQEELIYGYVWPDGTRVPGLNDAVQIPGLTNAWTMPIKTRIDMLSTGIKTPVGIKVMGKNLARLAAMSDEIATVIKTDPRTAPFTTSAFPEKSVGGRYLDVRIDRHAIARYGLSVAAVQDVVMSAVGGMNVTHTIEGLERYPVNLRYPHELRDNIPALKQTLVATPSGAQVPLEQLADFVITPGAPMVKSENARLTSWVYVDIEGIDVGTFVEQAQRAVDEAIELPPGYNIIWSGQYEYMLAANERLAVVIPLAALVIVLLLFLATRSWLRVGIVLLAVPFSLVGAVWLLYFLDYNLSLAVWVGVIALAGLDAETGLVMLLYLDNSFERFKRDGRMTTEADLRAAIHDGAVKRIRPKTMTVITTFIGLLPLLWADGAGADTMRRLAVPMIGGLFTSFIMELLVYPVLYDVAKSFAMRREAGAG